MMQKRVPRAFKESIFNLEYRKYLKHDYISDKHAPDILLGTVKLLYDDLPYPKNIYEIPEIDEPTTLPIRYNQNQSNNFVEIPRWLGMVIGKWSNPILLKSYFGGKNLYRIRETLVISQLTGSDKIAQIFGEMNPVFPDRTDSVPPLIEEATRKKLSHFDELIQPFILSAINEELEVLLDL